MKFGWRCAGIGFVLAVFWNGCGGGGSKPPINPPSPDTCSGQLITGVLHDSLTGKPVAQGLAALEAGTQLSPTVALYNFIPTKQASTDATGTFKLCVPSVASPSALVITALDASGSTYPPFISPISGAKDLGTVPMGGCAGTCGLVGEQQTTAPATIGGNITSAPGAVTGTIYGFIPTFALDGSKTASGDRIIWLLAAPDMSAGHTSAFSTAVNGCTGVSGPCTTYSIDLPSQSPMQLVNGGYLRPAAAPTYMIFATLNQGSVCTLNYGASFFTLTGGALQATPGAKLAAADVAFSGCQ